MKRKFKYAFTRKKETDGGFSSLILLVCALVVFLAAAGISFFYEGNAASWIGGLGIMGLLFSAYGFWIGIKSFQERDRNYRFSVMGAMGNGLFCVGWLALFLMGI